MATRSVSQVMREMGWAQGAALPVADPTNTRLQAMIEERMKRKAELIIENEMLDDKMEGLKKMLKSIENEKGRNDQVISSLKRQLEMEVTNLKLTETHYKRLNTEVASMTKEIAAMGGREAALKKALEGHEEKVKKLKEKVEWGEDTLVAWEEHLNRHVTDQTIVENMTIKDDDTVKELYQKILQAREENLTVKDLQKAVIEKTTTLEAELFAASQRIKQVNHEKTRLLANWEQTITSLRMRDHEIQRILQEVEESKKIFKEKYQTLLDKSSSYEKLKRLNDEEDYHITVLKKEIQKTRNSNKDLTNMVKSLRSELLISKQSLAELSSQLEGQRSHNAELVRSYSARVLYRDEIRSENMKLESMLNYLAADSRSEEQNSTNAEEIYKMGLKAKERMNREIEKTQDVLLKLLVELPKLKDDIETRENEIYDLENTIEYKDKDIENANNEIHEQDLKLYELEYQLSDLTGKIYEAKTRNVADQVILWKRKLEDMEEKLKVKNSAYNDLKAELKKATDDLQSVKSELAKREKEKQGHELRIKEVGILSETLEKSLKAAQAHHAHTLLQVNVVKMQSEAMREAMAKKGSSVSVLERERLCLESAMKERQLEIEAQKELLLARKKALLEERSSLRRSVEHLTIRVKQLQKRYEIAIDMLGRTSEGEQLSVTHFKIKSAQEKHELQEAGDELESKIVKAEKEIEAMENTLRLVTSANTTFKRNLDPIDADGPEMQERKDLELELFTVISTLKEKQCLIEQINQEIQELLRKVADLEMEEREIEEEWKSKDKELGELEKELGLKQGRLDRATTHILKLKKDLHVKKDPSVFKALAQREVEVRVRQDQQQSALQQLGELAAHYLEAGPLVTRYLAEKGLSLPRVTSRPSLTLSSRSMESSRPSSLASPSIRGSSYPSQQSLCD